MERVHDVFHVSMLRHYHSDMAHVIRWQEIEIQEDDAYEERSVQILDTRD